MGKSKEFGPDIFQRLEQGKLARARMIENVNTVNPVSCVDVGVPAAGDRLLPGRLPRLFLAGSAVGLAISLNFGVGDPSTVNAQDKTPTSRPTGTPTEKSTPTPTKTATATATASATVTATRTPTPNSVAARMAAEQTKIADLQVKAAQLRNLKDTLEVQKRLQQESANLQAEIDATNKIIALQEERNALVGSKKLEQEISDLQDEISALKGTPTKTATPTASPSATPTLTNEQKEIKQRAGLLPTNTPTPSQTRTTESERGIRTPERGTGGGLPLIEIAGITAALAAAYAFRTRIPLIRRIHIPGPHI